MNKLDFFNLNDSADLYKIIHEVYNEFINNPTEKDFLFLVLGLTHLREWISGCGWNEIDNKIKNKISLSEGEKFFVKIHKLKSFKIVQNLCNRGKHHITKSTKHKTSKIVGLRVGVGRCGDRLNQTYFLIDGIDSRNCFIELIYEYNRWFSKNG